MTKKKTKPSVRTKIPETKLPDVPATSEPEIVLVPEVSKVTIRSLPVGSRFEVEGVLFRKAFPVSKSREVGQKLVRHQFSATWMLGSAVSFDPDILVIPK